MQNLRTGWPLMGAALFALTSCMGTEAVGQMETPVVFAGRALESVAATEIEQLGAGVVANDLFATYSVPESLTKDVETDGATWWVVTPPTVRSGGFSLEVSVDDSGLVATACLRAPSGPATMALRDNSYLVAMPESVTRLKWLGACG